MIERFTLIFSMLFLMVAGTRGATVTNLHSFSSIHVSSIDGDGSEPVSGMVASGGMLYGTAPDGGVFGVGTVYAIGIGGGFSPLHYFDVTNGSGPSAGLVLSGNMLYGTTRAGGSNGLGTVFAISTDGNVFARLHDFGKTFGTDPATGLHTNSGGFFPETDLVLSSNVLYGATEQGGSGGGGTLYKIDTSGSNFTLLHDFTNADGNFPAPHMAVSGTNLFGTTLFGGSTFIMNTNIGNGTIFRVNTDGSGFTNLNNFTGISGDPRAGLVLSGNTLFGTAATGTSGVFGAPVGAVFKINTDGTDFTNFYIFNDELGQGSPSAGLAISGSTIYGTGETDGSDGVFEVSTNGTGYTNLTSFSNPTDPFSMSGLVLYGGNLYCNSKNGGANGGGTAFAVILVPQLNIQLTNKAVVLTWNDPSVSLYTAPTITGVFTQITGATSPYTNGITLTQQFFQVK